MVPQMCLAEKGYSEDEYILKNVDLSKHIPRRI